MRQVDDGLRLPLRTLLVLWFGFGCCVVALAAYVALLVVSL